MSFYELLTLLLSLAALTAIGLSIYFLVKCLQIEPLKDKVSSLEIKIKKLESQVDKLEKEKPVVASRRNVDLTAASRKFYFDLPSEEVHEEATEEKVEESVVVPVVEPAEPQSIVIAAPDRGTKAAFLISEEPIERPKPADKPEKEKFSWEYFIGGKLLAWIGGFTLFIGLACFAKYAIDKEMISPEMRVGITYGIALVLFVLGWFLGKKKYPVLSHTLNATGIVTLYLATAVAKMVYEFSAFTTTPLAAILLAATTALAFAMAVMKNAHVIALLGVVGGFLTPYMISTGQDSTAGLFCYISALNLALIAITWKKKWYYLPLAGAIFTVSLTGAWANMYLKPEHGYILLAYIFITSLFYVGGFVRELYRKEKNLWLYGIGVFLWIFYGYCFLGQICDLNSSKLHEWPVVVLLSLVSLPLAGHIVLSYARKSVSWSLLPGVVSYARLLPLFLEKNKSMTEWEFMLTLLLAGCACIVALLGVAGRILKENPGAKARLINLGVCAFMVFCLPFFASEGSLKTGWFYIYPTSFILMFLVCSRIWKINMAPFFALAGLVLSYYVDGSVAGDNVFYLYGAGMLLVFPFIFMRTFERAALPWVASAFSLPAVYLLLRNFFMKGTVQLPEYFPMWEDFPGALALVCAIPYIIAVVCLVHMLTPEVSIKRGKIPLYAGVLIGFITLAIGEQFTNEWLTIAFALEGAALLFLNRMWKHLGLVITGAALLVVAFVRFAFNKEVLQYDVATHEILLNWYLYAYTLVAACCLAGGTFVKECENIRKFPALSGIFNAMGVILLFVLLNLEIANFYSTPGSQTLTFNFGSSLACDLTYSLGWGLFALVLLIVGFAWKKGGARKAGVLLLIITLFKVFLYDLSALDQLYRVGALIGTAVIALLVSFLYQKFKNKLPMQE